VGCCKARSAGGIEQEGGVSQGVNTKLGNVDLERHLKVVLPHKVVIGGLDLTRTGSGVLHGWEGRFGGGGGDGGSRGRGKEDVQVVVVVEAGGVEARQVCRRSGRSAVPALLCCCCRSGLWRCMLVTQCWQGALPHNSPLHQCFQ
jgi:hypothetical protein